jgi:diacylglycerol kinase family enzyme
VWAVLALVAAGVAAAALVALVVRNLIAFAIVAAAIVVAAGAGWFALTRRGLRRVLAGVAGAAAVVAASVAFVAGGAVDELLVFAASAAVFAFLSGKALAPPSHLSTQASAATSPRAPRSSRPILLLNPKSGDGKVERLDLVAEARGRGVDTIVLQPGDDLHELAVAAAARRPRALGVAGGDGSQALVAQVAVEHGLPFVCIPAGTRNHFALDLGLDDANVAASLAAFEDGTTAQIDLGYVNDRVFVNNTSVGVYADIVQSRDYRHAKLMTALEAMPDLLGPDAEPAVLSYAAPDGTVRQSTQLLLVSNNPYELHRPLAIGTRPALDGGRLGIAALEIGGTLRAAEVAALELIGRSAASAGFTQWTADAFDVWGAAPIATAIDGEPVLLDERLRFRIAPAALTVVLPRDVFLRRRLHREAATAKIGTLGDVAIGRNGHSREDDIELANDA